MGIYNKGFNFRLEIGKAKEALIVILILLFVVFAIYTVFNVFSQSPLEVRFEQNPWIQLENKSVLLFVKIANTTGNDVKESILEVKPKAESSLIIFPQKAIISETLAPNDTRTLSFNVRSAIPEKKLPEGKYTIELRLLLDGKKFNSETVLEVK